MTKPFGRPTSTRRHLSLGALPSLGVISRAQFEPTGLTLAAAAGSFALTGTAAALKVARKLVAAAGSYALAGVDATLAKGGKVLLADVGSFALSGTAAALVLSRKIVAEAGAFALTGQAANLNKGQLLAAAGGSYAFTGTDAALKLGRKVAAAAGSYALTGTDALLNPTMSEVISALGLTSGLKLLLDAGDSASYSSSGQSWLDLSGGGYDFFRGATSGSEASDPTFNGTEGGRSLSEYFSVDGADYFRYDTTNETWMQNLHKNNALFTVAMWVYLGGLGSFSAFLGSNGGGNSTGTGIHLTNAVTTGLLTFRAMNAGTPALSVTASSAANPSATWHLLSLSVDEAAGASGGFFGVNSTYETFNSTYSSPAAGNASQTLEILARGNASAPAISGTRLGGVMAWEGVALTQAQITSIYTATRRRFNV